MTRFTPLKDFTDIATNYLAPVEPLVSAEQVNSWCSNKTHGKINKIISSLSHEIIMIILNAIFFKGEWTLQFENELTKLTFYNFGTNETNVETKTQI